MTVKVKSRSCILSTTRRVSFNLSKTINVYLIKRWSCSVSSTRVKQRADTDRWSPEGERRSPSEDEGDEKTPSAAAEIHNAEDHQEIFHPKKVLRKCRSADSLTLLSPAAVNQ